jgi:hypothetical protein
LKKKKKSTKKPSKRPSSATPDGKVASKIMYYFAACMVGWLVFDGKLTSTVKVIEP